MASHIFNLSWVLVLAAALSLWRFDAFQLGVYGDDAQYVVLARSLVDGPVYGLVSRPDIPASKFPFGWPLLLAPLVALSGGEYGMLKVASLLFTLANVALIVLGWPSLLRTPTTPRRGEVSSPSRWNAPSRWNMLALPAGLLYATSPLVIDHSRMVMSEPAFLFFALAGLLLTGARASTARRRLLLGLALGVVWVMAAYNRTIGVTLVAASVVWLLFQRQYYRLLLAVLSAAVFLTLLVAATPLRWSDLLQGGAYTNEMLSEPAVHEGEDPAVGDAPVETLSLATRVTYGLRGYGSTTVRDTLVPFIGGRTVARLLGPVGLGWLPGLASAAILLTIAAGFVASLRPPVQRSILSGAQRSRRMSGGASGPGAAWHSDARSQKGVLLQPVHLYVAFYAIVTIVWMWSLPRLLYGILPFLAGFMLLGLASAVDWVVTLVRRGAHRPTAFANAFVAFVVFVPFVANTTASLRIGDSRDHTPDLSAGTTWIRENTPHDSVVLSAAPEITYVYADRQGTPLAPAVEAIEPALAAAGVTEHRAYILLAPDLVWRDDGQLEVSPRTEALRAALNSSSVTVLAHEMPDQHVYVYEWLKREGN